MVAKYVFSALTAAGLLVAASGTVQADGDVEDGKKVFNKCKVCHTLEKGQNKIGPSLAGVIGRTAGTVEGFKYSDAMKESGIVWNEETLDKYLADPKGFIPGNKMAFAGLKKEDDREDVIAYLKSGGE